MNGSFVGCSNYPSCRCTGNKSEVFNGTENVRVSFFNGLYIWVVSFLDDLGEMH